MSYKRTDWLVGRPNSTKITRLDRGILGQVPTRADGSSARTGPICTTEYPFTLVPNEPQIIAAANPWRLGMMLQNKDPIANLFFSFGPVASVLSGFLVPGQVLLLDFICPTDQVSVFAAAAISGNYKDFSRSAE